MFRSVKLLARSLFYTPYTSYKQTTLYELKNRSFKNVDIKFECTTDVMVKEGNRTVTDNSVHYTLPTYEKKQNETNILTMIVRTKPEFDSNISFDDNNKCVQIELLPNNFKQQEGHPFMLYRNNTEMIDTTKYTYFSLVE